MSYNLLLLALLLVVLAAPQSSHAQVGYTPVVNPWTVGRIVGVLFAILAGLLLLLVCLRLMQRRNASRPSNFFAANQPPPPVLPYGQAPPSSPYAPPPPRPWGYNEQYPLQGQGGERPPPYNSKGSNAGEGAQYGYQPPIGPPPPPPPPQPAHTRDSDRFVGGFRSEAV
ncbi:hypothetical protein F5I97DRAFT_459495 [Phlebopus sp. FC_14]|nr:hypothetical protein F5I97DRAFT_459495 [Phlebopus sp. FC_14]